MRKTTKLGNVYLKSKEKAYPLTTEIDNIERVLHTDTTSKGVWANRSNQGDCLLQLLFLFPQVRSFSDGGLYEKTLAVSKKKIPRIFKYYHLTVM